MCASFTFSCGPSPNYIFYYFPIIDYKDCLLISLEDKKTKFNNHQSIISSLQFAYYIKRNYQDKWITENRRELGSTIQLLDVSLNTLWTVLRFCLDWITFILWLRFNLAIGYKFQIAYYFSFLSFLDFFLHPWL